MATKNLNPFELDKNAAIIGETSDKNSTSHQFSFDDPFGFYIFIRLA